MRLIDANELLNTVNIITDDITCPLHIAASIDQAIELAPTVDAVEVVHGRWTARDIIAKQAGYGQRYYNHAECKVSPCELFKVAYDYCPRCGVQMDGGVDDA